MVGGIYLRKVQIPDLKYLLDWENDPENWEVSDTEQAYSQEEMLQFILDQQMGDSEQCRYIICHELSHLPLGTIDLFSIDHQKKTAEVGILIAERKYRRKGYALLALLYLIALCKEEYHLNHLFCYIDAENKASVGLFEKAGFRWLKTLKRKNKNLHLYQVDLNTSL